MQSFSIVSGVAAAMPAANVDTDVIMPKQFLKGIDRSGLSNGVFHDLRFDGAGKKRPEFVLNQPAWANARFLVVGDNFGCGSSREHAVWGLGQLGIRALIGTSFAGIFFDNCARNGLLAIVVSQTASDHLMQLAAQEETNGLTIDLPQQTITAADGSAVSFEIDALRKVAMLRGLDSIDLTLQDREMIEDFEKIHFLGSPWLQGGAARARRS